MRRPEVRGMGRAYWVVVGVEVVFTLARFSEAFLVLRAQDVGLAIALAPLVMIAMNVVYAAAATPAGIVSDRIDRRIPPPATLGVLLLADLALALLPTIARVMLGAALWGLHVGIAPGLFAAPVADAAPDRLRGTAFGVYNRANRGLATGSSSITSDV